jgi:hypothetical protein
MDVHMVEKSITKAAKCCLEEGKVLYEANDRWMDGEEGGLGI